MLFVVLVFGICFMFSVLFGMCCLLFVVAFMVPDVLVVVVCWVLFVGRCLFVCSLLFVVP